MHGKSGSTYRVASTDTAAGLAAGVLSETTMGPIDSVTITCETNNVRVAIGTPTQGATGTGCLLLAGDIFEVEGYSDCAALKWISAASGVHGALQITPHYDYGT